MTRVEGMLSKISTAIFICSVFCGFGFCVEKSNLAKKDLYVFDHGAWTSVSKIPSKKTHFITVVGDVKFPGVYFYDPIDISLKEVIKKAEVPDQSTSIIKGKEPNKSNHFIMHYRVWMKRKNVNVFLPASGSVFFVIGNTKGSQ